MEPKERCKVDCPFCGQSSCARCKVLFHGALSCAEVQRMSIKNEVAVFAATEDDGDKLRCRHCAR